MGRHLALALALTLAVGCGTGVPTGPPSATGGPSPSGTGRLLPGLPTPPPPASVVAIPADTEAAVSSATAWGPISVTRLPIGLGGGQHFVFANAATPDGRYLIGTRQPDDFLPEGGHSQPGEVALYGVRDRDVVGMARLESSSSQVLSASADDRWVVWQEADDQPYFVNWRLRVYDRATGRVRELARAPIVGGGLLKGPLSFVSAGRGIALWGQGLGDRVRRGDMRDAVVRRADLASGGITTLASSAGWPSLSWPWAAWVVFDPGAAHVEVRNLETGASSSMGIRPSLLTLDGGSLAYSDESSAGIWLVDSVGGSGPGRLIARGPDKTVALEWPTLNARIVAWAQNGVSIVYDRLQDRLVSLPVASGWSSSTASGPLLVWEEMGSGAPVDQRWSDWIALVDTRSLGVQR